jgi:type IV pilus assembly protein PilE
MASGAMRNQKTAYEWKRFMKKITGFTLTELMITVVIVGILAAIAYPTYMDQMRKARRADAEAALLELSQFMERYYTQNLSYVDGKGLPPSLPFACLPTKSPQAQCGNPKTTRYYDLTSNATATTFTLIATPVPGSSQVKDECGILTLDNTGVKCIGDGTTCSKPADQVDAVAAVMNCWGG